MTADEARAGRARQLATEYGEPEPIFTGGAFLRLGRRTGSQIAAEFPRPARPAPAPPAPTVTPIAAPAAYQQDWAETETIAATTRFRERILNDEGLDTLADPEWLIDGMLALDSIAIAVGPSGQYKTFVAIDLAGHVGNGIPWQGHSVKCGPVVYVIGESARGVKQRGQAWREHHDRHQTGVRWYPEALQIGDPASIAALTEYATEIGAVMIVFDTLARSTVGTEENSAKEMGLIINTLDQLRAATGACVLCVHHTGKDPTAGARGSSATFAAIETELNITGKNLSATVKTTKQKNGDPYPAITLRLDRVADSLAILSGIDAEIRTDGLTENMLDELASVDGQDEGVGVSAKTISDDTEIPATTVRRDVGVLAGTGYLERFGGTKPVYRLTEKGRGVADRVRIMRET